MTNDIRLQGPDVKGEILAQHASLRGRLRQVKDAAAGVMAGAGVAPLLTHLRGLLAVLEEHMAFEERALLPIVRRRGMAAAAAADRLLEEHAQQRQELRTMAAIADEPDDNVSLAFAAQAFVSDVLCDMDFEEEHHLREPWRGLDDGEAAAYGD